MINNFAIFNLLALISLALAGWALHSWVQRRNVVSLVVALPLIGAGLHYFVLSIILNVTS